jgi:PPP family 3-phenylpropionic acid transporter
MTLVFATPLSALADRRGWRIPLLRIALAGFALTFFLIGFPRTFATLVPFVVLLSLFFSPIMPIADSLIARMSARHGLNYGSMRFWGSFGFATMAIACGALWQQIGFAPMFGLTSLMFIPVIWYATFLEEEPVVDVQARRPISVIARDPGLVAILLTAFLVGLAMATAMLFEGIYMDSLGGSKLLIGLLSGIIAFSELPTMRYSSLIARYLRGPKTLLAAYGLMGLAYLGYTLAWAPGVLLLLGAVKGLGFGLYFVSTVRLVDARAPGEWASTAQAMLTAGSFGLAPLIAGPLGGVIYDAFGPAAVFVVGAVAVGLAAVVLVLATVRGWLDESR